MIEKNIRQLRVNGSVVKNVKTFYWGPTDTYYFINKEKTLNEYTWAEIETMAVQGTAQQKFKIGDTKDITLTTGETITVRIIGFDHDPIGFYTRKACITFETVNLLADKKAFDSSYYSNVTYDGSDLRSYLNTTIYNALPDDLKSRLCDVQKQIYTTYQNTALYYVFALSQKEITGSGLSEGSQYAFYISNPGAQKRLKRLSNGSGAVNTYWTRTYWSSSSQYSYRTVIDSSGNINSKHCTGTGGVSFAFCIGDPGVNPTTPLSAPTISINGSVVSWNAVANASNYAIYANGTHLMYANTTSVDLAQNITTAGTHTIQVKARGRGSYSDSALSNSVSYTKPDTAFTVTIRRTDTAEFSTGFSIGVRCGTQTVWFSSPDDTQTLTVASSTTPIVFTFGGASGTSYTEASYVIQGAVRENKSGDKSVGTSRDVTVYGTGAGIIDVNYYGR